MNAREHTIRAAAALILCLSSAPVAAQATAAKEGKLQAPAGLVADIAKAIEPKLRVIPDLHGSWDGHGHPEKKDSTARPVFRVIGDLAEPYTSLTYGQNSTIMLPTWKVAGQSPNCSWAADNPV
ncbi:MAG TPA: hypothetical protein PLD58_20115, partial [Phycisphaerae bacterium]|nr:hypothetical protein [Phycisphaerae bacterium]